MIKDDLDLVYVLSIFTIDLNICVNDKQIISFISN